MLELSRGMIVRVEASDKDRDERPARDFLVVENDRVNRHAGVVLVAPIAAKRASQNDPRVVLLGRLQGRLQQESVVDCGLILTIRRDLIATVLARVNSETLT